MKKSKVVALLSSLLWTLLFAPQVASGQGLSKPPFPQEHPLYGAKNYQLLPDSTVKGIHYRTLKWYAVKRAGADYNLGRCTWAVAELANQKRDLLGIIAHKDSTIASKTKESDVNLELFQDCVEAGKKSNTNTWWRGAKTGFLVGGVTVVAIVVLPAAIASSLD